MVYQDCNRCKNELKDSKEIPCNECGNEREGYEPKTNADAIRNMSDEELAKRIFLEFDVKDVCRFCIPTMRTEGKCDGKCKSGILQWLQSEVKEGNTNEST